MLLSEITIGQTVQYRWTGAQGIVTAINGIAVSVRFHLVGSYVTDIFTAADLMAVG